jgi:hypothetical protein
MNVRFPIVPLLALVATACADRGPTTPPAAAPPVPAPALALECQANVRARTVECVPPAAPPRGPRHHQHTQGGQGTYVRVATSGVGYAGGEFTFSLTVQNLSNLAFATSDGVARHDDGVRVFFHSGPTVTGGAGVITVDNETGTGVFTAADQPYFQYGGKIGGIDQGDLGVDGMLGVGETSTAKTWELAVPATVTTFSFLLLVSTQTTAGAIATSAPQVTSVAPATMVPGTTATLTGINFDGTPASNTVTIGGVAATVTAATITTLDVTVPCIATGTAAVQVTVATKKGVAFDHPLDVPDITLDEGESAILDGAGEAACNEITATGVTSDYVVAVYNTDGAPLSTSEFQLSGDGVAGPAPSLAPLPGRRAAAALHRPPAPPLGLDAVMALARERRADELHLDLLERNRAAYQRLRARFGDEPRMRAPRDEASFDPPPATATFQVADLTEADFCDNSFTVDATRVYYDGKLAIYEDDDNPITDAGNATLAAYYDAIGAQFNADMEPVVTGFFGDPLLRDDVTDDNDVVIALFTHVINDNFPGVAGFVVSCDQYPSGVGNTASNHGEYFYAMVPTSTTPGYGSSSTLDAWFWSIRATFIHETKHVAAYSARVAAAAASFESSWLEEGMARHSEELWAREEVYNVAWKANTGYGSAGSPGSLYCDYRRTDAACLATDPSRPSLNVFRHFSGLYTFLDDPVGYSPFGPTAAGGSSFYATSWSLLRYAADRYAADEGDFLTALTGSTETGIDNLETVAGVPIETLLGGWALALFADDYPGLAGGGADITMPTWNFTDIYAGLNDDFGGSFPAVYPLVPTAVAFGTFGPLSVPSIAGGGVAYFQFTGMHATPQLLKLEAAGGGAPPSALRIAVARLE